jgi:hypothetical protein
VWCLHCVFPTFSIDSIRLIESSCHAMRVPAPPRLGQLAHLFPVSPAAAFGCKNMLASLRRHYHNRDPFGSPDTVLPSPTTTTSSTSSDVDPKFDTETVADDRTLVGSRRHSSSHSDEEDVITLGDVPEDQECAKSQYSSSARGPSTYSSTRDPSARRSIIYPLPSAENLLTHEPTTPPPATAIDSSVAPPLCIPALSPPPTHYKRRRARIISNEDHDPDLDQASIRCVCVISLLGYDRC